LLDIPVNLLVFNLRTDADDDVLGFTTDWVNGLAARCKKVFVITMSAGRIAVADNVQVYSVGKERGFSEPRRALEFYRLLKRLLRHECIDACFAHMMPLFAVMGWPLLRSRRVPIILWYAHKHAPLMVKLATRVVDRVVASSQSGFTVQTKKLRIIGQGIDVARFRPAARRERTQSFTLLTTGRISSIKRLELLIKALSLLPERLPDGRAIIARYVGAPLTPRDQLYAEELRRLSLARGLNARVEFLDAVPFRSIDELYRRADLFVNCSDTDSVDKTVLEAMSSGLPVVTSNAAFDEVFDRAYAAKYRIKKGSHETLARTIEALLQMSDEERKLLGHDLRRIVCRDHSLDSLCDRLLAQVSELAHRRR
jgi:glycosyltransferase involved in cell wall biosynthesis